MNIKFFQSYYNAHFESQKLLRYRKKFDLLLSEKDSKKKIFSIAIVSLVSSRDFNRYIIAISSLLNYFSFLPRIILLDDGTLTSVEYAHFNSLFPEGIILRGNTVFSFLKLSFNKFSEAIMHCEQHVLDRKILDLIYIKRQYHIKKFLLMDSDVVFYKSPKEILEFFQSEKMNMLFISDYQDAYIGDRKLLEKTWKCSLKPKLNSGLIAFDSKIIVSNMIDKYYKNVTSIPKSQIHMAKWAEQTFFSVLAEQCVSKVLSNNYYVGLEKSTASLICRHYVEPSRHYYLKDLAHWNKS